MPLASPDGNSHDSDLTVETADPSLQVVDAWKAFGHVVALRGASLTAYPGEVLALVGDNGAGKSTLVKVIAGVHSMDSGELRVNGNLVTRADPLAAQRRGISTVFQDLAIVETLDVAANMFLGQPIRRARIFADRGRMIEEAVVTLRDLKIRVPNARAAAGELSGGQRQGVAIARAIRQDNPIILMDEPTAALGVSETAHIEEIIAELRGRRKSVILVSHDLEFVFRVADRVQVLRLGRVQGCRRIRETDRREVVGLITGAVSADSEEGDPAATSEVGL